MSLQLVTDKAAATPECARALLEVKDLQVCYRQGGTMKPIIDSVSLKIHAGEVLALVGESGSGKSITGLSLMRLLPRGIEITGGSIRFDGEDVLAMSEAALNGLRGGRIAMLFQQPQAMLDPTSRVRTQVAEPLRLHRKLGRRRAFARVIELLRDVGIPDPVERSRCFSHELSGGMAQRVMIAAAMGANPQLLIADEPTTALDVTVQAQILRLIDDERHKRQLATLLITHDLSIVAAFADRVVVMYAGQIVEEGPTAQILQDAQHPYTQALIRCSLLVTEADGQLLSIPGSGAYARDIACGCRFQPRCALASDSGLAPHCQKQAPLLLPVEEDRQARCFAVERSTRHA